MGTVPEAGGHTPEQPPVAGDNSLVDSITTLTLDGNQGEISNQAKSRRGSQEDLPSNNCSPGISDRLDMTPTEFYFTPSTTLAPVNIRREKLLVKSVVPTPQSLTRDATSMIHLEEPDKPEDPNPQRILPQTTDHTIINHIMANPLTPAGQLHVVGNDTSILIISKMGELETELENDTTGTQNGDDIKPSALHTSPALEETSNLTNNPGVNHEAISTTAETLPESPIRPQTPPGESHKLPITSDDPKPELLSRLPELLNILQPRQNKEGYDIYGTAGEPPLPKTKTIHNS